MCIEFEVENQIALIRLNRPEVHNVINAEMMAKWENILAKIDSQPEITGIILTGAGEKTFSAGGDLSYFATLANRSQVEEMSIRMQKILDRLQRGPQVVVAAINGQTLGGGCEIVSACHFRVAVPHASFSFRHASNGVITGWGGGQRLMDILGIDSALSLFLCASELKTTQALETGLLHQITNPRNLLKEAKGWIERVRCNSSQSVRSFLSLAQSFSKRNEEQDKKERELFLDCWEGEDFQKVLDKFRPKKEPDSSDFLFKVAGEEDSSYAQEISEQIAESAKVRGTGIAQRPPEYIQKKMTEGKAIIAIEKATGQVAGFCYIETWEHQKYAANSGLIVFPQFRQKGLAKKIKEKSFELSREKYPQAKLFGLTTNLAVMKINSSLGYHPVTYAELTQDDMFWKGCQSCVNYSILQSKDRKNCMCTAMIYDPQDKEENL